MRTQIGRCQYIDFEDTFPTSTEEDFPFGYTWNVFYEYTASITITVCGNDSIQVRENMWVDFYDTEISDSHLVMAVRDMLDKQVSTDIVLVAKDGTEFPCHQIFLSGIKN